MKFTNLSQYATKTPLELKYEEWVKGAEDMTMPSFEENQWRKALTAAFYAGALTAYGTIQPPDDRRRMSLDAIETVARCVAHAEYAHMTARGWSNADAS